MKKRKTLSTHEFRNIFFVILILLSVYMCVFVCVRNNTRKTTFKYFDSGKSVIYGGIEYKFTAKLYNIQDFMKTFNIDINKEKIDEYTSKSLLVVEEKMKRVEEFQEKERIPSSFFVINRYFYMGTELDLQEQIKQETNIPAEQLKLGEENCSYQVYGFSGDSYCREIRDNIENAALYLELPDYKGSEYIVRVRLTDGDFGEMR